MYYETGCWHPWDGRGACPFDPETTEFYTLAIDGSRNCFNNPSEGSGTLVDECRTEAAWKHRPGFRNVVAFYIVSYHKAKEMTVAEIEKALGHKVKVVK